MDSHKYEIAILATGAIVSLIGGFVAKSMQAPPPARQIDAPAVDEHSKQVQSEPLVRYQGTESELKNDARW